MVSTSNLVTMINWVASLSQSVQVVGWVELKTSWDCDTNSI